MSAFEGNYLEGNPEAQLAWRQRQIRIALAVLAGVPLATVAEQEEVTRERIRQILHMACIHSIRLPKRKVKFPTDERHWSSMASLRTHKEFWRGRLRALERVWKLPRTQVQHRDAGEGRAAPAT
jgi:hypothetical protein